MSLRLSENCKPFKGVGDDATPSQGGILLRLSNPLGQCMQLNGRIHT
jgi:vancomycin resistance protein YoaR